LLQTDAHPNSGEKFRVGISLEHPRRS
jgi:hypothetical protein